VKYNLEIDFPAQPIYLGKPSTSKPLEVFDVKAPQVNTFFVWQ